MFSQTLRRAIETAPRDRLALLKADIWKAHGAGSLSDDEAQSLAELAQARSRIPIEPPKPKPRRSVGSTPRTPESIDRRRKWAAGTETPGCHRGKFTMSQVASLNFILRRCVKRGACRLPLEAIAGAVGTCKTVVRETVRRAVEAGLIESKQHRHSYWRSSPNTIRVTSQALKDWLRIGAEMAARRAGAALRTKAQAAKTWFHRKADERRAARVLRGEARAASLEAAAESRARRQEALRAGAASRDGGNARARVADELLAALRGDAAARPKSEASFQEGGGSRFAGPTPKSSFYEEAVELRLNREKNVSLRDNTHSSGLFEAVQPNEGSITLHAAQRVAERLGIYADRPLYEDEGTILDAVAYQRT